MKTEYVVVKDGKPCRYLQQSQVPLECPRGVLAPVAENESPRCFGKKKAAGRAIDRTLTVAQKIRTSVVYDWPAVKKITEPGDFEIKTRFRLMNPPKPKKAKRQVAQSL